MGRRIVQLMVPVVVSCLPLVAAVAPARADNASALLALVNALRATHGAGPMYADPTLTQVAQGWSVHMATAKMLSHNPDEGSQLAGGWTKLGENVGLGGTVNIIFNAFVNSPFHYENMIDPTFNLSGIGVVLGPGGTLWVTQDFEAKPGATPVTTRPPATTSTTTRPSTPTVPVAAGGVTTTGPTVPPTTLATTPPPVSTTNTAPQAGVQTPSTIVGPPGPSASGPSGPSASRSPGSPLQHQLALSAHGKSGGSPSGWLVTVTALAIVVLAAAALFVNRIMRSAGANVHKVSR